MALLFYFWPVIHYWENVIRFPIHHFQLSNFVYSNSHKYVPF